MPGESNLSDIILFSLDKLSHLNKYLSRETAGKEGLSLIQLQIIDHICRSAPYTVTVSSIAEEFELTKATVSESVNNLAGKGYIEKSHGRHDKRVVYLTCSKNAAKPVAAFLEKDKILNKILLNIPDLENMKVADFFPVLFKQLIDENIIQQVRMCIGCGNFEENAKPGSITPHHCRLTGRYFNNVQMNTNCNHFIKEA